MWEFPQGTAHTHPKYWPVRGLARPGSSVRCAVRARVRRRLDAQAPHRDWRLTLRCVRGARDGRAVLLFEDRDARPIVIDEMAGFLVTLLWLPLNLMTLFLGFVLFRVFDIVKPPPIGILEKRLHGGWGIVLDDVLAGVFANVTLRLLLIVAGLL